jgi:hypothetical protein
MFGSRGSSVNAANPCLGYANANPNSACIEGSGFAGGNNQVVYGPIGLEVTLSHLEAVTSATATGQIATVLVNGAESGLSCTIVGTECLNPVGVVRVPVGAFLQVRITTGGTNVAWVATFLMSGTGA